MTIIPRAAAPPKECGVGELCPPRLPCAAGCKARFETSGPCAVDRCLEVLQKLRARERPHHEMRSTLAEPPAEHGPEPLLARQIQRDGMVVLASLPWHSSLLSEDSEHTALQHPRAPGNGRHHLKALERKTLRGVHVRLEKQDGE